MVFYYTVFVYMINKLVVLFTWRKHFLFLDNKNRNQTRRYEKKYNIFLLATYSVMTKLTWQTTLQRKNALPFVVYAVWKQTKKRSKKAFSVIFCGSSSGAYLPPMTVYKALHYYKVWTTGGQSGAIYDATKSFWLDRPTF